MSMYTGFYKNMKEFGIECAADLARRSGFESVEMLEIREARLVPDEKSAMLVKNALDDRGLATSCYSFAVDIIPFDIQGNILGGTEKAEKLTIDAAKIAKTLGTKFFHHTLVTNLRPDLHRLKPEYDRVLHTLISAAARIAEECNDMGLTVLYEPQGFYVNGSDNFGKFYFVMKRLGYDVGVCGDMANTLFVDEPPVEFYRNFVSEFRHVHLKDYALPGKMSDPQKKCLFSIGGNAYSETFPGEGTVDFNGCMNILKSAGYNGALSFEISGFGGDPEEENRRIIEKVSEYF